MAQRTVRDLYLQVGGNVTGLQTASRAGKSALLELGTAAGDVQAAVDRAFADMAANAPAAAKALERSYSQTFAAIRSNAQAALAAPSQGAALQILDAGAAIRSAEAAERQAIALRQVATAASAVAERAGAASEAERVLAVAAAANAQQAEQEAAALRAQASVLSSVSGELRAMGVAQRTAVTSTNAHRQALIQTGAQFQDFTVQVVSGQSVALAFAQQIGQLSFAVQGLEGRFAAVGRFLGGPWGIALTTALTVLAPFVGKLFEGEDAADAAKAGATGLADAQSVLGNMFDLTSGKLQRQNELLRLNARLTAANLRADAAKARASSESTFGSAGQISTGDRLAGFGQGIAVGNINGLIGALSGTREGQRNAENLRNIVASVRGGRLSPERALQLAQTQSFTGVSVSREAFTQALIDATAAPLKEKVANAIDKSIDSGVLDPSFRKTDTGRAAGRGRTAGRGRSTASPDLVTPESLFSLSQRSEFRGATRAPDDDALQRQFDAVFGKEDPLKDAVDGALKRSNDTAAEREREAVERAGKPLEQYRQQLRAAVDDMDGALQGVAAHGFQALEDGFVGLINGTESAASAFRKMAASIIADLARIAIQKAILKAIPGVGQFLGFAEGGEVQKNAAGGLIRGAGTGTSDDILSWLSNGEFVITAAATRRYLPVLKAMNDNRLPAFAEGGLVGNGITLPSVAGAYRDVSAARQQRVAVDVNANIEAAPEFDVRMQSVATRTVGAAAEPLMAGAEARTMRTLRRPALPGAPG